MHTIKLDVSDTVFDKVMFFLDNLPKNEVKLKIETRKKDLRQHNIVDFFHKSPLRDSIVIEREKEIYMDRFNF